MPFEEARNVTQHSLERDIDRRVHDLRVEAYRSALVRSARPHRTPWIARALRALAARLDSPRTAAGPWLDDYRKPART